MVVVVVVVACVGWSIALTLSNAMCSAAYATMESTYVREINQLSTDAICVVRERMLVETLTPAAMRHN